MDKDYLIKRFDSLLKYFPQEIKGVLKELPFQYKLSAEEIRLRAGSPLAITVCGTQFFILKKGVSITPKGDMYITSAAQVEESFLNMCNHSVYSHAEEICEGYIILPEGHRAGICGRAVVKDKEIKSLREISSINLRIAKEVNFCSEEIVKDGFDGGILVCGAPGSGKTTLIRDMVRRLSSGICGKCYKISVIDTRGEIGGVCSGKPTADLGSTTDILTAFPKSKGIEIALRTLYPDIIVFDELGNMEEVKGIKESMNSGVGIITSAHIGNINDLYKREQTRTLLKLGAIKKIVFCHKDKGFSYDIIKVCDLEKEILCEV
jgi:stage III sporulation protein AA